MGENVTALVTTLTSVAADLHESPYVREHFTFHIHTYLSWPGGAWCSLEEHRSTPVDVWGG